MINPKIKRLADSLERDEKVEPNTTYAIVLDMVGSDKRVLEFGCGSGELSRKLAAAGNRVTGIALGGPTEEAAGSCEEIVVADLDARSLTEFLPSRMFDVAVFGDVLDRLRDPWRVLDDTRRYLAPGGYAVLSVPNVVHGSIRLAFLRGRFEIQNGGALDRSYHRFFTLKSIHELCFRAGYRVVEIERTKLAMFAPEGSPQKLKPDDFDREIVREIETDPEHDTLQFIIRAAPLSDEERLAALVDTAVDAEIRTNDARFKLKRVEEEAVAYRERAAELEERIAHETTARARVDDELTALREKLTHTERLPALERALAGAGERIAALEARALVLAEQLDLANGRVAEYQRLNDLLRGERAAFEAEAAAVRSASERTSEELADSRGAANLARQGFAAEVERVRSVVADVQRRVDLARGVAEEAIGERDAALALRDAAEAASRRLESELLEAKMAAEQRIAGIEDLRFQLEQEAAKLRDVVADRNAIREAHDAQQASATAFLTHVEAELARTRREILLVDGLIRQVQNSRWWLAKRALGKIKRIVLSKIRR